MLLLVTVELVVLADVIVRDQQEPTGAASWIMDRLPRRRPHHVNNGPDQWTRRKVNVKASPLLSPNCYKGEAPAVIVQRKINYVLFAGWLNGLDDVQRWQCDKKRLVRIRHFGLFANRRRGEMLSRCRTLLGITDCANDPDITTQLRCPVCSGPMLVIERLTSSQLSFRSGLILPTPLRCNVDTS